MMPTVIGDVNVDRILADLHYFLKAYPSYTWKNRQTDVPLRTVKTILHTFVKIKGSKVCCASFPHYMNEIGYIDSIVCHTVDQNLISFVDQDHWLDS